MIYVLPGMGADERMYTGAWRTLTGCTFINWPANPPEESIAAIAARIVAENSICDGAVLVGSSLGGIVACEIAKIRRSKHLFLVGSAKNREEINGLLRLLHPIVDLAPLPFIQRVSGKLPSEVLAMFSTSSPRFVRNMCRAIFQWDGLRDEITPVSRIHGRHDLVIPPPDDVDELIEGGHLIAMTHPAECARFVVANKSRDPIPLRGVDYI
jgi:pimeloyl-ACP methyl ester carboxylesterase